MIGLLKSRKEKKLQVALLNVQIVDLSLSDRNDGDFNSMSPREGGRWTPKYSGSHERKPIRTNLSV